jgi:carboxymethylenebutenolidase
MSVWCGLAVLAGALSATQVRAADEPEAVKKTSGSYFSARRTIRVTRFEPVRPGRYPALLLLHGADGLSTNEATYHHIADRLARENYVVFVVSYFDCFADRPQELAFFRNNIKAFLRSDAPERERLQAGFEECLTTVCDGVRYVRRQPGVDEERIGLVGLSLGAFLALSAATEEDLRIAAVVDLFGGLPEWRRRQARHLPPVLVLHGDADPVVPVSEARNLETMLREHRIEHQIQVYEGVGHMFEDEKGRFQWLAAQDAERRALAFLRQRLHRPPGGMTGEQP